MKYLCLIYDEEKKLGAMPKSESDAFMGEYGAFTEGIKKSGHYESHRRSRRRRSGASRSGRSWSSTSNSHGGPSLRSEGSED